MKKKALVVFSGGLDSILVAELLKRQDFDVIALTFVTPFFDAEKAVEAVKKLKIKHIIQNVTEEHLKIVKNPKNGYGKNMNPCLDCHGFMFKIAGKIAEAKGMEVVATGEVVGQRPFSQNKQALRRVEKIAGMEDKILRPLSAKALPKTVYEKEGIVNRDQMFEFVGKGRKEQLELAEKWGIDYFPTPAGGCLLTDPGFSGRLKDLFEHHSSAEEDEINLLKMGRQFWCGENKIVIGRHKEDNIKMRSAFNENKMIMLKLMHFAGPLGLVYISDNDDVLPALRLAGEKIKYYSLKTRDLPSVELKYWGLESGEFCVDF